ncbi:dTMP kinase [Methylophaga thiooxydans]|uniref:Thymidylate kinase n=1 Tax=Methylophaga thiooxydans DMS010 TaxID=637616 RepID=C0N2D3_9GAMM|nr:dTMP kinase [Methylophaga thiooxydans]EEF81203.1 thymidylate kinase [Methylophaga thiooxydans DMS010]
MNGKFISIEGIEGAGKSTQMRFIQSFLEHQGKTVVVTREPGGTVLGEQIRELLLTPRDEGMSHDAELLLMFAARAEHLEQVIKPALSRGDWVLSDRFVDATFAYQGGGRGIDIKRIESISDWTLQAIHTDLTLLFDLPVAVGQERVIKRSQDKDRFEQEKGVFFEKIRQCYLQRADHEPDRIKKIDAGQTIENIQHQVTTALMALL